MKKIFFLFLLPVLAASCKNEPKTNTPIQQTASPENDVEQAKAILNTAKTTLAEMQNLRKQIDALPDAVKSANPTDVENLRGTLEGMEEKETMYIEQLGGVLSSAEAAPAGADNPAGDDGAAHTAVIKECTESLTLLAEEMKVLKEQFDALSKKQ